MRRPTSAARWSCAPVVALALAWFGACSAVDEAGTPTGLNEPPPASRLARIHVVLQPPGEAPSDDPALEVLARFAQYRGLDEAAVGARADIQPLPIDRLRPGQCIPSEQLWVAAEEPTTRDSASRELVFVDAGNMIVQIGEASVDVPLSLVPDLLPYMSGVEYELVSEALPPLAFPPGEPGPTHLTITVDGAGDDELPGFVVRAPIPEPALLQATPSPDRSSLLLEWRPDGRGAPVLVRLSSFIGSEPAGDELTCLLSDTGSHRFDLDDLRVAGLDLSGDTLHVGASRLARVRFDTTEQFTRDNAEAVIEVRSAALVVWP
jgi:hypothetical protein